MMVKLIKYKKIESNEVVEIYVSRNSFIDQNNSFLNNCLKQS